MLYGGEFTLVNNKRQQGLVRFAVSSIAPDKEGPRVTGASFKPTLTTPSAGTVKVTWKSNYDRDNELLTYQVLRNGAVVRTQTGLSVDWSRPTISWTDTGRTPGTTYSYRIRVSDPFGNTVTGDAVSVRAASAATLTQTPDPTTPTEPKVAPNVNLLPAPEVAPDAKVVPEPEVVPDPKVVPVPEVVPDPKVVPVPEPEVVPDLNVLPAPKGQD